MTELGIELERLGLSSYIDRLVSEGFDTWESVLDITESDLEILGFKLGHRRVLQRAIATARGVPEDEPLPASFFYKAFSEGPAEENDGRSSPRGQRQDPKQQGNQGKRKYRRHPKADEHAPEKPPSAYVMFANHVREELKGQNLSFTEIAKMVGDRWKVLVPEQKQEYENEAQMAKEKYNAELAEYKKTDHYKEYMQYLSDFRSRASKDASDVATPSANERKRQRLESLSGVGIGSATVPADPVPPSQSALGSVSSMRRGHAGSISSTDSGNVSTLALSNPSAYSSPGGFSTAHLPLGPHHSTSPKHAFSHEHPLQGYPHQQHHSHSLHQQSPHHHQEPSTPPSSISSYRDAMARVTQHQRMETLIAPSPGVQPLVSYSRGTPGSSYNRRGPPLQTSQQLPQGSNSSFPRPAMKHADTVSTQESYSSSGSSSVPSMTPITPLDSDHRSVQSHGTHSGHSRALPLPTPNSVVSPSGYFDQRPGRGTSNMPPSPSRTLPPYPSQRIPSPRAQLPPIVQRSPPLREATARPKDDRDTAME